MEYFFYLISLHIVSSFVGYYYDEAMCVAANIYHEARGERIEGKIAVANVVMNRVANKSFPNTPCGVVKDAKHRNGKLIKNKCQFSWYCDGKQDVVDLDKKNYNINGNKKEFNKAMFIAILVMTNIIPDNTGGALFYHANYITPKWSKKFVMVASFDNQLSYKPIQ